MAIAPSPVSVRCPSPDVSRAFDSALLIANYDTARFMEESVFYAAACNVLPPFGHALAPGATVNIEARTL